MDDVLDKRKAHRKRQAGPKADKKKSKHSVDQSLTAQQRNPRAFSIQHANKTLKTVRRTQDLKTKKQHIPVVDRTPLEPPPIVVGVVGPPKVGKTTLLKCVVKNYSKQKLTKIQGPVTVVSGKQRRLTLIECNNDISAMIDIAKVADLVLLLVDASFGFEMETFEFLNICQVHGFPRMMGVLTHLDTFKDCKKLRKTKKRLKNRFWTEVFQGAKLFYLSGLVNGEYQKTQIHNLCRFISVMKFRPLTWRTTHPYILADRMEDITDPETIRQSPKVDRNISLYGYLHGTHMKNNINVHIPGCGDFTLHDVQFLSDPCPTPEKRKKRTLTDKERIVYAPMSGVGGIVYDKDAVYIDLGGSHSHTNPEKDEDSTQPVNELVSSLLSISDPLDKKMTTSEVTLFSEGVKSLDTFNDEESEEEDHSGGRHFETVHTDGRVRRRAVFNKEDEKSKSEQSDESDDEDLDGDDSDDDSEDEDDEFEMEENDAIVYDSDKMNNTKLKQKEGKFDKANLVFDESDEDDGEIYFKQAKKQKTDIEDSDEEISFKQVKKQKPDIKESGQKEKQNSSIDDDSDEIEEYDSSDNELSEDDELDDNEELNDDNDDDNDNDDDDDDDDKGKVGNGNVVQKKKANGHKSVKEAHKDLNKVTIQKTSKSQNNNDSGSESGSSSESDSGASDKETSASSQSVSKIKQNIVSKNTEKSESLSQKLLALSETDYFSLNAKKKSVQRVSETDRKEEVTHKIEMKDDDEYDEDMEMEEEDEEDVSFRWKHDLASQAAANFRQRQASRVNYRKLIYGKDESETRDKDDEDEEDEIGGLFKVLKEKSEASSRAAVNSKDCSKCLINNLVKLELEQIQDLIADCFVTGKWDDDKDAEALLKKDEELYGDFEDLETGEAHSANQGDDESKEDADKDKQPEEVKKKKSEMTADERRAEKKRKLKEMFDTQYDMKGDTEFYDNWKEELEQQAKMNRSVFEDMDDELRVQYEGFRPGMYVRVEIHDVPCEFVINFDATYPLILGGLLSIENNVGFVQDHNMRNRLLKYTPEHLHCHATLWGPITPQGTGLLAVENVANVTPDFRIAATGVVLELDKSQQIVKKLKLTGTPLKIYNKTAFIQGMFNTALEVAKFEGASVRTVSGLRGQIKKAVKTPEGAFRATFEDKILLSDIVFLRTWYPVEVPQFYNPVTTLLLPKSEKQGWTGLKTLGQLHREKNIKPIVSDDSKYKKVERKAKIYTPLSIPKSLQKVLPFENTPKSLLMKKDPIERVAILREPHEAKVAKMMSMLKSVYEHKNRTGRMKMKERVTEHKKEMQKLDNEKRMKLREAKKQVFKMLGKMGKGKGKKK